MTAPEEQWRDQWDWGTCTNWLVPEFQGERWTDRRRGWVHYYDTDLGQFDFLPGFPNEQIDLPFGEDNPDPNLNSTIRMTRRMFPPRRHSGGFRECCSRAIGAVSGGYWTGRARRRPAALSQKGGLSSAPKKCAQLLHRVPPSRGLAQSLEGQLFFVDRAWNAWSEGAVVVSAMTYR